VSVSALLKGALIEYASDFLGPLPNVVVFQFNPEQISRTLHVPERPTGASSREPTQAGDVPVEHIELTLRLSADDDALPPFVRTVGILPPLAALEKMVRPAGPIFSAVAALDAVASAVGGASAAPTQPIPRQQYPRILFVWGTSRILPVEFTSMQITETQYDALLNPITAEVQIGMNVIIPDDTTDAVASGASKYSEGALEVLAALNLGYALPQAINLVKF
jgi:hypothetical protein